MSSLPQPLPQQDKVWTLSKHVLSDYLTTWYITTTVVLRLYEYHHRQVQRDHIPTRTVVRTQDEYCIFF